MTVATQTTSTAPLSATVEAMRQAHAAALKQIAEARQSLLALIGDDAPLATEMQALNATVATVNAHIAEQISQVQALVAGVQANFAGAAQTIAQALTGITGTVSETQATTLTQTGTEEQAALLASETTRESLDALAAVRQPAAAQHAQDDHVSEPTTEEIAAREDAEWHDEADTMEYAGEATTPEDDGDGETTYIPYEPSPAKPIQPAPKEEPEPKSPAPAEPIADAVIQAANASVQHPPGVAAALEEIRRNPKRSNVAIGRAVGVSEYTVRQARRIFLGEQS